MVTVIGLWDDAWFESEKTERRIWRQTIEGFGVDEWIMVPDHKTAVDRPKQMDTIEEALAACPGKKTFLMLPTTVEGADLVTYQHQLDAIYVFGNTADSLLIHMRPEDEALSIYTSNPRGCEMFAHATLAAVLFSRLAQERAV